MLSPTTIRTNSNVPFHPLSKAQLLAKGVTVASVTASMYRMEFIIDTYNRKYDSNPWNAPEEERREWRTALNLWDVFKASRDVLKGQ